LGESILKSDHRAIFLDLDLLLLFGTYLERLERPQFRNLKFDEPRISDSYRKLLHKQFECHNIYDRVRKISQRGKDDDWSNEDERCYKVLDRDITAAMLRSAEKCSIRKQHDIPWAPSLSKATHAIRYWTRRISKNGIRHIDDSVLDHFLEHSDVDASYFDKTTTVKECVSELRNEKAKFKDVIDEATSNGDLYEVEVATAGVERRYPHLIEDNVMQAQER
jgi:HEPN domain-containing protein